MTERAVTGNVPASKYRRAQKLADQLGLTDDDMTTLAAGVREFDATQADGHRQTRALEKIANNTTPVSPDASHEFEERRLRRREVTALELMALATLAADNPVDVEKIKAGATYQRLFARYNSQHPDSVITP